LFFYLILFSILVETKLECNKEVNPIIKAIEKIRNQLVPLFIKKWYTHPPHYINGVLCRCNFTLTADGNWKKTRTKCIYGDP
jgi:hypothetical protein